MQKLVTLGLKSRSKKLVQHKIPKRKLAEIPTINISILEISLLFPNRNKLLQKQSIVFHL